MLCPMRFNIIGRPLAGWSDDEVKRGVDCVKEKCAWFCRTYKGCAVSKIADTAEVNYLSLKD